MLPCFLLLVHWDIVLTGKRLSFPFLLYFCIFGSTLNPSPRYVGKRPMLHVETRGVSHTKRRNGSRKLIDITN